MKILVTGGAGFIGSNFLKYLLSNCENSCKVINLDCLTYAGNLENLNSVEKFDNYVFEKGDICDTDFVNSLFTKYDIDTVVNFAAESHVDRSITNPQIFLMTNILGTQTLLDAAKKHWKINPDDKYDTSYRDGVKFLQVSTD